LRGRPTITPCTTSWVCTIAMLAKQSPRRCGPYMPADCCPRGM
jgi:hypothetical protein